MDFSPRFSSPPDADLQQAIRAALDAENRGYLERLSAEVENGRVILEGIVRSYHEKQIALSCIQKGAPSATIIDNTLVIPSPPPAAISKHSHSHAHAPRELEDAAR